MIKYFAVYRYLNFRPPVANYVIVDLACARVWLYKECKMEISESFASFDNVQSVNGVDSRLKHCGGSGQTGFEDKDMGLPDLGASVVSRSNLCAGEEDRQRCPHECRAK